MLGHSFGALLAAGHSYKAGRALGPPRAGGVSAILIGVDEASHVAELLSQYPHPWRDRSGSQGSCRMASTSNIESEKL